MRSSPSIVPGTDRDIYLVLDDFGSRLGRAWAETDEGHTDRGTLLRHLMEGQCRSSASTPAKAGRRMLRRRSPPSCSGAAQSAAKSRRR